MITEERDILLREINDYIVLPINTTISDVSAATAANYGTFFVCPFHNAIVWKIYERHETAGTDVGSVTLDIEKLPSGTAEGSGTSVLASTINLKATAATYQGATRSATIANTQLTTGDSLALKTSGTLTSVNNVTITILLRIPLKNLPR